MGRLGEASFPTCLPLPSLATLTGTPSITRRPTCSLPLVQLFNIRGTVQCRAGSEEEPLPNHRLAYRRPRGGEAAAAPCQSAFAALCLQPAVRRLIEGAAGDKPIDCRATDSKQASKRKQRVQATSPPIAASRCSVCVAGVLPPLSAGVRSVPLCFVQALQCVESRSDPSASHNCWAYKVGQSYRSSDDGEPGGTAGRPILAAIEGEGLDGVCVLVTR